MLGTVAFLSTGFLPTPIDKIVIGIQAFCFSLAALLVPRGGATFAAFVAGALLSLVRVWLFPFSLLFSLFYGSLIDGVFAVLGKSSIENRRARLSVLLMIVTAIVGVVSMYLTTIMGMLPMVPIMYIAIIAFAIPNGAIASYAVVKIWNRYLALIFREKSAKK